jgi:hypothetical protein
MRAGKWCPYHLAQIFAYRLHARSSGWVTTHITTAGMIRYPYAKKRTSQPGQERHAA